MELEREKEIFSYKISANYLSNFMPKRKFLEQTIKRMAFIPRYNYEYLDYLKISFDMEEINGVFLPMVCFCDIPLHQLSVHAEGSQGYGKFGIALTKEWGDRQGLQPIHYINPNSKFSKQFRNSLNLVLNQISQHDEIDKTIDEISESLFEQLCFMKPNVGCMDKTIDDKKAQIKKNFHDEHEWRYIPNLQTDEILEMIIDPIDQEYFVAERDTRIFTDLLIKIKRSYLPFRATDVKYIFVETGKDRLDLINFVLSLKGRKINKQEKHLIISKIIVYSDLVEDL